MTHECELQRKYTMSTSQEQPSQADIFSALQSSSFRPKTAPKTEAFATVGEAGPSGTRNSRKFYCFRPECSSVILQKDTAEVVCDAISHVSYLSLSVRADS